MSNRIDELISYFSPKLASQRVRYRMFYESLKKIEKRRYEGASVSRRTSGWVATDTGANTEIGPALSRLRARSRDLVRNNPYASRAVQVISSNVVGAGIVPQAKTKRLNDLWEMWGDTPFCHYDGQLNFYGIQALAMREIVEAGEVLIRRIYNSSADFPVTLQVLEPDYLDVNREGLLSSGAYVKNGIEFDRQGRRVAYYIFREHPGENPLTGMGMQSVRIPAEDIIHAYRIDRAGQVRGVPWGAPCLLKLKDLDEYEDAQLVRQKIASCFTAFITEPDPTDGSTTQTSGIDEKLEPGLIEELPPGKGIEFANPPTIGADYEPYVSVGLRAIATGFGVTYEALTQDYSKVNFSSGRMGWMEFQRNIDQWRWNLVVPSICAVVWRWFFEAAALIGKASLNRPEDASWTPPRREMIDPVKETTAQVKAIRSGLKTLSEAIREQGNDPEQQLEEMANDNKLLDKYRLQLDSDPRTMTENGQKVSDDAGESDGE